jgi:AraC-like DNA-binding protein
MSKLRQEDESVLARTFGLTFTHTRLLPPTSQTWDQLVYAIKGVLTVSTESGTWVVPPYRAIWVPANTSSTLEVHGQTALRMLYLRKDRTRLPFDRERCCVLSVSPLLRELILRTVKLGALKRESPVHRRMAGLIKDELQAVDTVPLQLPFPTSELGRRFVEIIEASAFEIEAAIRQCGASRRTMERTFREETHMSLGQWVRRRKLLEGLRMLAKGEAATSAAFTLGYNGPSAFIAMFKRELGATPGSYLSAGIK